MAQPRRFSHTDKSTWISSSSAGPLYPIIAPSVLAADFASLGAECKSVLQEENGAAEWLHLDVMDGHFVPNMSFGQPVVASLRKALPNAFFDVHLMVSEPEKWVADFAAAGSSQFTFHIEATQDARQLAALIRKHGMQVGVSVKPKTPVSTLFSLVEEGLVDMVLVMTVEPGFGGQKFMQDMMPKVQELRRRFPTLNIEVDGGIGLDNIAIASEAGANVVVAGTSVFKAKSRFDAISGMRTTIANSLESRTKQRGPSKM